MVARCRSCEAPIQWARTPRGKLIPLDPNPRPDGNLELRYVNGFAEARVVTREREQELEQELLAANRDGRRTPLLLYVSHFATCPDAKHHRRVAVAVAAGDGREEGGGQ